MVHSDDEMASMHSPLLLPTLPYLLMVLPLLLHLQHGRHVPYFLPSLQSFLRPFLEPAKEEADPAGAHGEAGDERGQGGRIDSGECQERFVLPHDLKGGERRVYIGMAQESIEENIDQIKRFSSAPTISPSLVLSFPPSLPPYLIELHVSEAGGPPPFLLDVGMLWIRRKGGRGRGGG